MIEESASNKREGGKAKRNETCASTNTCDYCVEFSGHCGGVRRSSRGVAAI